MCNDDKRAVGIVACQKCQDANQAGDGGHENSNQPGPAFHHQYADGRDGIKENGKDMKCQGLDLGCDDGVVSGEDIGKSNQKKEQTAGNQSGSQAGVQFAEQAGK